MLKRSLENVIGLAVLGQLAMVSACSSMAFSQAHSVALSWTQSSSPGITSNKVYRSQTSGGGYVAIYTSSAPVVSYTDTTVTTQQTYYYVVTAICGACAPAESAFSNEVQAVIPANGQPLAPTNLFIPTGGLRLKVK